MAMVSESGQCQGRVGKKQMLVKYVANDKEKSVAAVFYSKSSTELPKVVKKVKMEKPAKEKISGVVHFRSRQSQSSVKCELEDDKTDAWWHRMYRCLGFRQK